MGIYLLKLGHGLFKSVCVKVWQSPLNKDTVTLLYEHFCIYFLFLVPT